MKATGIVRRIDDLGRVVIPKEIRRTMRIREGDPLEIYTDNDGEVIFKKYSPIGELGKFAVSYAEVLSKSINYGVCICDKDNVVAYFGVPKKDFDERKISRDIDDYLDKKTTFVNHQGKKINVVDGNDKYQASLVCPIMFEADYIGGIILINNSESRRSIGEMEEILVQTASNFLAKQMEEA